MAQLFDHICRTLATPMPRSRALKLILGGLAGAVLAPFGFGQTPQCPSNTDTCVGFTQGNIKDCCPPGQQCCTDTASRYCCPRPQSCCLGHCCQPNTTCNKGTGACEANPTPRKP